MDTHPLTRLQGYVTLSPNCNVGAAKVKTARETIIRSIIDDLYDVPIIGNIYRGDYVERLIVLSLGTGFHLVSADWAGWDIESDAGLRIEVKQSAALQTWSAADTPAKGKFSIEEKQGYWVAGNRWIAEPGRPADLYILAWHPIDDRDLADHREPAQWRFFVVPARQLPAGQKTIARSVVERQWPAVSNAALRDAVLRAAKHG